MKNISGLESRPKMKKGEKYIIYNTKLDGSVIVEGEATLKSKVPLFGQDDTDEWMVDFGDKVGIRRRIVRPGFETSEQKKALKVWKQQKKLSLFPKKCMGQIKHNFPNYLNDREVIITGVTSSIGKKSVSIGVYGPESGIEFAAVVRKETLKEIHSLIGKMLEELNNDKDAL